MRVTARLRFRGSRRDDGPQSWEGLGGWLLLCLLHGSAYMSSAKFACSPNFPTPVTHQVVICSLYTYLAFRIYLD